MKFKIPKNLSLPLEGGFYAGRILIDRTEYALIVAPKAEGEHADGPWYSSSASVAEALSYCDGFANTRAMAKAGSELAKWAIGLRIGGHADWYLPSQDELEICYRNLKPTTEENSLWSRSGINVSAVPPTYPYTADLPKQTKNKLFCADGAEAFDPVWYWTSTQHASGSSYAWVQYFSDGYQTTSHKVSYGRARAVRRLKI